MCIVLLAASSCEHLPKVKANKRPDKSNDTVVLKDTVVIRDTLVKYSPQDWQIGFGLSHDAQLDTIWGKAVDFYISDPECDALAFDFYYGSFKPADNASTAELLELSLTKNEKLRPFYRWCLDKTIEVADGALAEYPGEPARKYAEKYPAEFFEFIDANKNGNTYYNWVEIIKYSGLYEYKYDKETAYEQIKSRMKSNCKQCGSKMLERIDEFAKAVTVTDEIDDTEAGEEDEIEAQEASDGNTP